MLDPTASRFGQAAILSGLMDVEALKACWEAIPPEKREAPEHIDRRLARQAVQSKALTLWQAQQLLAGRSSGFKVDRYVLLELIGQGGMGRVYLARDTRLNRRVALKILAPERVSNPRAVARFQREARVGAQLQHENLVRVYDFGESSGRFFLVMEFIEGRTIGSLLTEQGPMPPATAARLVRQVAQGLAHADRKGLIHRDVNPYNIMVTHDGVAKLADLGLAIDVAENDRVTRDGATVGTFDYVAPEQARHSHSADIRSDIYSLGCSLYHMLTGQVPFPSPSLPEKLFAHQAMEPTPVEHLVPGLPPGLGDVVRTMMRKQPEERYSTPSQVVQALEPFIDEGLPTVRAEPVRSPGQDAHPPGAGGRELSSRDESSDRSTSASDLPAEPAIGPGPISPRPDLERVLAARAATPATMIANARGSSPSPAGGIAAVAGTSSPGSADLESQGLPLLTPTDDVAEDRGGLPFVVDLGPEPPLRPAPTRPKPVVGAQLAAIFSRPAAPAPAPAPAPGAPATRGPLPSSWRSLPPWARVAIPAALLALLGLGLVAVAGKLPLSWGKAASTGPRTEAGGGEGPIPPKEQRRASSIVVASEGPEPGDVAEAATLAEAVKTAMGRGISGYVGLRNREPLSIGPGDFIDLAGAIGTLNLRASPGYQPVIDVKTDGKRPFLATGSAVSLTLSGLTIRVHYTTSEGTRPAALPPLIHAAGRIELRQCAIEVVGPRPEGSRALFAEGSNVSVDRCWFLGFDQPIRIKAFDQTTALVRQTMIVAGPGPGAGTGISPELRGWALGVEVAPGKDAKTAGKRRLTLEHCTIEGAGLLDLAGDPGAHPLPVDVKHCAVRAEALLAWKPRKPGNPFAADVKWQGEGNQFDIAGRYWVMGVAATMTPAFTQEVHDLQTWAKFVGRELEPIKTHIRYPTEPQKRRESLRPRDLAVESADPPDQRPGAEPLLVGPWGR